MEKISTVLVRDPNNRSKVLDEITPGCEWVFEGEGIPTRKFDGTCVMLDNEGKWWSRREVKEGKVEPNGFMFVSFDENTGKTMGWEPIEQSAFYKFFLEALSYEEPTEVGTYELVGPKINTNETNWANQPFEKHYLFEHATAPVIEELKNTPLCSIRNALDRWCDETGAEGVVWHHPDGRMAKLKARDL